jgi:hypothetical protein
MIPDNEGGYKGQAHAILSLVTHFRPSHRCWRVLPPKRPTWSGCTLYSVSTANSPRCFTRCAAHAIFSTVLPEWRNWQTQQTQNLPGITPRVGSTPSSGTILFTRKYGRFRIETPRGHGFGAVKNTKSTGTPKSPAFVPAGYLSDQSVPEHRASVRLFRRFLLPVKR